MICTKRAKVSQKIDQLIIRQHVDSIKVQSTPRIKTNMVQFPDMKIIKQNIEKDSNKNKLIHQ